MPFKWYFYIFLSVFLDFASLCFKYQSWLAGTLLVICTGGWIAATLFERRVHIDAGDRHKAYSIRFSLLAM